MFGTFDAQSIKNVDTAKEKDHEARKVCQEHNSSL